MKTFKLNLKSSVQSKARWLLTLIVLLTLGVGQMWAWDISSSTFYVDNTSFGQSSLQLLVGSDDNKWSCSYNMTLISGTNNLYYKSSFSSGGWGTFYVATGNWGTENCENSKDDAKPSKRAEYCKPHTSNIGYSYSSKYVLIVPSSSSNNCSYTQTAYTSYSSLNYTQTLYQCVAENGGTPAKSTASIATIGITTKKLNGNSSTTDDNGNITSGQNSVAKSAARTATVTMTATSIADGYSFLGWYDSETGGTRLESSTTYTYQATAAKTVYARFSHETTHSVAITYTCASPSATVSTATAQAIGQVTASAISAPTVAGYTFVNWTLGTGVQDQGSDLTANPISVKTLSSGTYTMQANYTEDLTSTYHIVGTPTSIFAGSEAWATNVDNMLRKASGSSASSAGSVTFNVTALPATESSYQFKAKNTDGDSWYGWGSGSNYHITREATNPTLDGSENLYFRPDALGEYTFALNWSGTNPTLNVTFPTAYAVNFGKRTGGSSVTAKYNSVAFTTGTKVQSGKSVTFTQTAATGYTFEGWYNAASGGSKLSSDATYTTTISAATTVYANYTENKSSITISAGTGGTVTTGSGTHSLGVATTQAINASANPGYGWNKWTISGTAALGSAATSASNTAKTNGTAGSTGAITATFTANTWYVQFNGNGSTSGSMSNESFTYDAAAKALTPNAFSRTGYTFQGWATSTERANAGTVDYANGASVSNLTTTANGIYNLYAVWQANNYTVTFDYTTNGGAIGELNGATNTAGVVTKSVTFGSAYGALPTATKLAKGFVGWFTTANDDSETGTRVTAETIVSTASAHTLYARFEDTYEVTVAYKCGDVTLYPSTKVTASASSLTPEITALEILGYEFSNWTGTNVTPASSTSATTTITATASTTITANYTAVPTVYFKNNLGWENVYVTFDCDFNSSKENVPANDGKPYFKMTQLGTSDIYYCAIPETYTASNYSGWAWNIAFDNTNMGSTAETTHTGTWDAFCGGEFLGRGDFDPKATMFIPYSEDFETRNSGKCYTTGCWMKYNSTDPGYSVKVNTKVTGENADALTVNLTADVAGGFEFRGKADLESSDYTYGFKLYKDYLKNYTDIYYSNSGEIWATTTTLPWDFSTKVNGEAVTANSQRCGLHTEALGEYEFIVSFGTGRPVVDVVYPVSVGDWRLVYKDLATWSGEAHTASWSHPSRVIKAKASTEDIVSFYVAYGHSPSIELQKCTAINASTGAQTWTKQSDVSLSSITATGIYNFKVSQNESKVATVTFDGGYKGNFYIRTDASDGGWSNYKTSGKNTMTYSEYAETQAAADKRFSHYFMRHVYKGANIKFCIANDYSDCISDTLVDDTYASEWIGNEANIRFMWYHATNKISRAYLSGSSIVSDRFLVLEGDDKMFDANENALNISGLNANEINFTDDQNWIYETTVKAQPHARIKLTAKFADKIQYFYGTEGARTNETTEELIGGSGTDKYMLRVVYDFKTNRLIKAFIPSGTISSDQAINTDLMIIREHQDDAQQVSFSGDGKLSEVKTVYGAMKFNKWTVNNKDKAAGHASAGLNAYARDLFWISFPFDVKLGEVFGFGTYGTHWIIEYYDGKGRAANGFWADSPSNWKFVTPQMRSTFTLNANEGYVLALALDELEESSDVWNNGVEDVYLYFPSSATVSDIQSTNKKIDIDQEGYKCTINRPTPDGNRTIKDSYWHVIGVPSYANYSSGLTNIKDGTPIDWTSSSLPFLYEWNPNTNAVTITSSANFAFKAMHSYLVQYAGASIYWSAINATPASVAARTKKQADYNLTLSLMDGENKADHTMIRLTEDENVSHAFEFNYDLCKENNKNCNNIWTVTTDGLPVAGNSMPFSTQTISIPVGVLIANAGEYTFSIPDGTEGVGVTLIDNVAETRTNLALTDYTVSLEKGTFDNRFTLEISPIKNSPTDIDNVQSDNLQGTKARKVMIDGILYIVRDGKIFDARGTRVE